MRCEHPFLEDNGSSYLSRCRPPRRRRARVNRKMWRPKTITDSSARCISGRIVSREQSFPPRPGKGRIVLSLRIVYRREWRRESPRDDQEAVKFKDPRRSTQLLNTPSPILRHALFLQSTSQDRSHFSSYSATFRRSFETAPAANEQISTLDCGGQASALKTHYNGA